MTTAERATATSVGQGGDGAPPRPPRDRRRRRLGPIPARVRILAWLILLMTLVLVTVAVVTRNLLLRQVYVQVNSALEQEAREFSSVAANGVDRATQQPFRDVRELVDNHLRRQYPDDDEVMIGWVSGPGAGEVLRQDRQTPFELAGAPEILDPILASAESSGSAPTPAGEMRWIKVTVADTAPSDLTGALVVGYFVDAAKAEADETIRTLSLVSVLGLLLAASAAWLVAGQILAPVRLVHRAAEQITEQDLTRRIPVEGNDEFAALARQFNTMLERLERAFVAQREFLDDVSHELRTPITIVRGHLELMDAVESDAAERADVVRLCTDELDRMGRMVEDLLLLAKSERADFLRPAATDLAELTSDIHAKIRALADRQWRLEAIGEGEVTVDEQRITQAMVQLADNATRHTKRGDVITFGSALQRDSVSFWITDTGPGVADGDIDGLFERFSRGGGPPQRDRAGAGLGLAIVRAIAVAHGGTVKVLSPPGHGATFGIELPVRGAGA